MKKKFIIILILFVVFITFIAGFSNSYVSHRIEHLAYVLVLGIDKGEKAKLKISTQFINVSSSSSGASLTIPSLIPVSSTIFSGIGFSGLTNVSNVSTTTPFLILTAPISVIFSFCAESPVVSISKQTNVPSRLSS